MTDAHLAKLQRRVDEMDLPAKIVLEEAGLPTDDPWQTVTRLPGDDHCLFAAAYLRLRAYYLHRFIQQGDIAQACQAAMDVEHYWNELVILDHVQVYGRRMPPPDFRRGRSPEEIYLHDMSAGARTRRGAISAHQATHGSREAKVRRWQQYQSALNDLLERRPHLSTTQARSLVAEAFGCSPKTVTRHTVNPRKRKK